MKFRALFANTDAALGWQYSLAVVLGVTLSAALGLLTDRVLGGHAVAISVMVGLFLSVVAVSAPLVLALRLLWVSGALMVLMVGLATASAGVPWLAGILVAMVLLVASVWTAIPIFGNLIGTFPVIVFVLIVAEGAKLSGGASLLRSMLAAACGVLGAVGVALLLGGADPRRASRAMVAKCWLPGATRESQGSVLQILRLDSAPRALISLVHSSILASLGREVISEKLPDAPALEDGLAADAAIAAAIIPKGSVVPRSVDPAAAGAASAMMTVAAEERDQQTAVAWRLWSWGVSRATNTLAGKVAPGAEVVTSNQLLVGMWRTMVSPDASAFRFGIQRAIAVGLGVVLLGYSDHSTNVFWITVSIFTALQADVAATVRRASQAAVGTWVGAVVALLASLLLPQEVLVPWLALVLLVAGFAWLNRNYLTMTAGLAAAIVLVTGVPQQDVAKWAGLRAVDVALGALIAVVVSRVIFRVRPRPAAHLAQMVSGLARSSTALRALLAKRAAPGTFTLADARSWSNSQVAIIAEVARARANLRTDLGQLADRADYELALARANTCADALFALSSLANDPDQAGAGPSVSRGLDEVDAQLAELGARGTRQA